MNLRKLLLTKNECYIRGTKIKPCGVMVHSTAANNPYIKRYVGPDDGLLGVNKNGNHWNVFHPGGKDVGQHTYKSDGTGKCAVCGGTQKCVHGFIGKLEDGSIATYQTLPWTTKGWHAGGNANAMGYIGFEICEDGLTDKSYFNAVYKEAVEFTAYLCNEYSLDPLEDGVVICHQEGYRRGIASNHGDVLHWFPKMGKTMDDFRRDVATEMRKEEDDQMLTYEQWKAYMERYRKELGALPAPEWAVKTEEWVKATEMSLTDGTRPQDIASRAEVAAMILRAK